MPIRGEPMPPQSPASAGSQPPPRLIFPLQPPKFSCPFCGALEWEACRCNGTQPFSSLLDSEFCILNHCPLSLQLALLCVPRCNMPITTGFATLLEVPRPCSVLQCGTRTLGRGQTGQKLPTHIVSWCQLLDVVQRHIDPHHAQDELVLEGSTRQQNQWVHPHLGPSPSGSTHGCSRELCSPSGSTEGTGPQECSYLPVTVVLCQVEHRQRSRHHQPQPL